MKFMYTLFLLVGISSLAFAQLNNSIYPLAAYSDLQNIAAKGDNIVALGDCDVAMISTDGGLEWTTFAISESFRDLEMVPGSNGEQAYCMTQNDLFILDVETKSFVQITDDNFNLMAGTLRKLVVDNNKVYLVTGAAVYSSNHSNHIWEKLGSYTFSDVSDYIRSADISESWLYVGSNEGEVGRMNLSDGASEIAFDFESRINKIEVVSDNLTYVSVSGHSSFAKSTDGGFNWSSINVSENINPIAFGDNFIMSVNTNRFYVSTDGGESSEYVEIEDRSYVDLVSAAYVTDDGVLYFSGRSNMIIRSTDFAQSFENLNRYKRADLRGIHFDGDIGYAVGDYGSIVKTTNKGVDWLPIDGLISDTYISDVITYSDGRTVFVDDVGLTIALDDVVIESHAILVDAMFRINNSDDLLSVQTVGGDKMIAKSTDRGSTWESKVFISEGYYKFHQSPTGKIYKPTGTSEVYTSVDNGETWSVETFGISDITEVSFLNDDQGIFVANGSIYKTTNAGLNALEISSAYAIRNIYYIDEDHMMFTTAQNGQTYVRVSEDGGSVFQTLGEYCSSSNASYYDGDKTVWLVQRGGHINKYVFDFGLSSSYELQNEEIVLYPNPIVSESKLYFETKSDINTGQLTLRNISGAIVYRTILNGNEFLIGDLPSGLYVLQLWTAEGMVSKKIFIQGK